ENLPVDYGDALEAVFAGQVQISGAVLSPTVSGSIVINDGEIRPNQLLQEAGSINLPTAEEVEATSPYRVAYLGEAAFEAPLEEDLDAEKSLATVLLEQIKLQNLELVFGDRLAIVGTPFYNITAIGDIAVNGSLANLQPAGTVELKSGWINLFSTEFRLNPNAANTATFTPEAGLNPYVDVVMTARVQDADITPAPPSAGGFLNAEVNESSVDTVGTVSYVNVDAVAMGPASELSDTLTLTSDSSRSQGELLALLSSSVFSDVTTASYTQVA
ncbi:MAG: translocation/assembly module TamB domain-containing protein, partial [Cyanobacteria bacterium J06576_12]